MVLRSIRTVMAMRGMAIATAAKNRYFRALPKCSSPGKLPGTNQCSITPNTQESRMPVKNGGTAMQSWFTDVRAPSSRPPARRADRSPRGMDTTVMSRKLKTLRHSVTSTLGPIRSHTGCL